MAPSRVYRATDDFAREVVNRVVRWGLVLLGLLIIVAGILIAPLPGPGGIPVIVVGLMIVLRNSFYMRRQFVKIQRAHPKVIFPIRRLLRREPEVLPVVWQQYLRVERIVLPQRLRFAIKTRKRYAARKRR